MNTDTNCERVRISLMASLDDERGWRSAPDAQHLSACPSCQRWLNTLQTMGDQLQGLSYPVAHVDLWAAVQSRIRQPKQLPAPRQLWSIVALILGWRALQLCIDLPIPVLHPFVPLAAATVAVWLIRGDPMAIETWAPELHKRGV